MYVIMLLLLITKNTTSHGVNPHDDDHSFRSDNDNNTILSSVYLVSTMYLSIILEMSEDYGV
jgi:hypothetical protein